MLPSTVAVVRVEEVKRVERQREGEVERQRKSGKGAGRKAKERRGVSGRSSTC